MTTLNCKNTLLLIMLMAAFSSLSQLYTFKNFNHRDGLNMAAVTSIDQSEDGFIWLGTDGGPINRFDGTNFEEVIVKGRDNNYHVNRLNVYNDSILIATKYKGCLIYSRSKNSYIAKIASNKTIGEAYAAFKQGKNLYMVASKGIFVNDGTTTLLHQAKGDLQLYHYTRFKFGEIVFTSEGNFILINGKISPLSKILQTNSFDDSNFRFAYCQGENIVFLDKHGTHWLEGFFNNNGRFQIIKEETTAISPFIHPMQDEIISLYSTELGKKTILVTNRGRLFNILDYKLNYIPKNFNGDVKSPENVFIDVNGDIWISSLTKGVYKVSQEPFTKVELHEVYGRFDIAFPFKTIYGDFIISTFDKKTFLGQKQRYEFLEFPFETKAVTFQNGAYYFATTNGVKRLNSSEANKFQTIWFEGKNTTYITHDVNNLYVGLVGEGLFKINTLTGEISDYNNQQIPDYFYTSQNLGSSIYFGTNGGIYQLNLKTNNFTKCKYSPEFGSYSGVSTKDRFGNIWFTLEKGLIAIRKDGTIVEIKTDKLINSNLFYTLSADLIGNIIVGTNKGISILKVDENANVIHSANYDANSGFMGFESHMRSQFRIDNYVYMGTVEGLFVVNTELLQKNSAPFAPIIKNITPDSEEHPAGDYSFSFHVNNTKVGNIQYEYKFKYQKKWTKLAKGHIVRFYNLKNGKHTLEVRASYDGINYGRINTYNFNVHLPFWQTTNFILGSIFLIVALNVLLIRFSNLFDRNKLVKTGETESHLQITPTVIIIGAFSIVLTQFAAHIFGSKIELHLPVLLAVVLLLFGLFFSSKSFQRSNKDQYLSIHLIIAFGIMIGFYYYMIYTTHLNPYELIGLILTTMSVPFFFFKWKEIISFASVILMVSILISLIVTDVVYPKSYFIIANIMLVLVLVFIGFLRSESLDKVLFISNIINKGNIPAIAFNNDGTILYCSENISKFIPSNAKDLIKNNIAILNSYVPFEEHFREVDVLKEFKDGEEYLVPMINDTSEIHWISWEYKDFTPDIKVMIGQDVTEKLDLENTYELLVQQAEDFIYRCDVEGNFVFMNEASFSKLGYEKDDLIGKHSIAIVPEDYRQDIIDYYANHFHQRTPNSYKEFPIQKKNGDIVWIGQFVTTLFSTGSKTHINGYIAMARDITNIREQQNVIKEQRDSITSSINYAQRIQFNLLPHERNFASNFKEYFIIYRPKDIVSGDFYWIEKIGTKTIVALADCTGHGVPGAFMTLLGINLLNSIVLESRIMDPAGILNELDKRLNDILQRENAINSVTDGMEITICVMDSENDEMAYGCAGSRFLISDNNEFTLLNGDNKHIGDAKGKDFNGYQTHYTKFTSNNYLYLLTDGMQDQFGGENDKKFSFRRILELLEDSKANSLVNQRAFIQEALNAWIGNGEQTDDISMIAIRKNIQFETENDEDESK